MSKAMQSQWLVRKGLPTMGEHSDSHYFGNPEFPVRLKTLQDRSNPPASPPKRGRPRIPTQLHSAIPRPSIINEY